MQRLSSLDFNSEDPANAEAYRQYERKMEISKELTTRKKDLQKAKDLVLTVWFELRTTMMNMMMMNMMMNMMMINMMMNMMNMMNMMMTVIMITSRKPYRR